MEHNDSLLKQLKETDVKLDASINLIKKMEKEIDESDKVLKGLKS